MFLDGVWCMVFCFWCMELFVLFLILVGRLELLLEGRHEAVPGLHGLRLGAAAAGVWRVVQLEGQRALASAEVSGLRHLQTWCMMYGV